MKRKKPLKKPVNPPAPTLPQPPKSWTIQDLTRRALELARTHKPAAAVEVLHRTQAMALLKKLRTTFMPEKRLALIFEYERQVLAEARATYFLTYPDKMPARAHLGPGIAQILLDLVRRDQRADFYLMASLAGAEGLDDLWMGCRRRLGLV